MRGFPASFGACFQPQMCGLGTPNFTVCTCCWWFEISATTFVGLVYRYFMVCTCCSWCELRLQLLWTFQGRNASAKHRPENLSFVTLDPLKCERVEYRNLTVCACCAWCELQPRRHGHLTDVTLVPNIAPRIIAVLQPTTR